MKSKVLLIAVTFFYTTAFAQQEQQVISLSPKQIESLFIEQNLQLLAERMNIDLADAAVIQAKLWDNPTFSIYDISFWSTLSQRDGEVEAIPPLFGSFGRNTQFGLELSQLIQTAGKRRKLIRREEVSKEIVIQEFEELLRELKTELRVSVNEIRYLQSYQKVLTAQIESLTKLTDTYEKQVTLGNMSVNELLRLQSALLEFKNESNEVQMELNYRQKNLKALLGAEPSLYIEIEDENISVKDPEEIPLETLIDMAMEFRPDMKIADLYVRYHEKSLAYEKAQRSPDLTISMNYDRWGGVWKNFIGVGISIDLPVIHRNQGNIKAANIAREQSMYYARYQQNLVLHELAEAYGNYALSYDFYKKTSENPLFSKLDAILEVYSKNLLNRNISMLEYIDFMDSYKMNKQIILSAYKKMSNQFEELQYTIGTDIK